MLEWKEYLVYALVVGAFLAIGWMFIGGSDEESQFEHDANWDRLPFIFKATWGFIAFFEGSLGGMLAEWMPKRAKRYAELCEISALPLSPSRILAASFALGLMGLVIGVTAAIAVNFAAPDIGVWGGVPICLAFFAMGWFWPSQNLAHYAEVRQEKLTKELPFAIDLIGGAMKAGLEFGAAMRYFVSLKSGGPLEEEFSRVLTDTSLGRPFQDAINDMAKRVRIEAFTSFSGVISYGMEIGAPISQTLKSHGSDLRRERFALAERKANRAPSIMIIPLALFIMPAVFIIVLTPLIISLIGAF